MKEPPSQTFAHVLADLTSVPGEFIACLEWQRTASDRMRRDIQTRRRHFFNKRVSLVNYVTPETRPEEMLVDDSASAVVRQLGEAMTELEANGHFFGACSLTLALHGLDHRALEHQAAEAMKTLAVHDGNRTRRQVPRRHPSSRRHRTPTGSATTRIGCARWRPRRSGSSRPPSKPPTRRRRCTSTSQRKPLRRIRSRPTGAGVSTRAYSRATSPSADGLRTSDPMRDSRGRQAALSTKACRLSMKSPTR
jgi:hypothetical protein